MFLRLDRGNVFFGILAITILVLTVSLGAVVYNGSPSQSPVPGDSSQIPERYLELPVLGSEIVNPQITDAVTSGSPDANTSGYPDLLGSGAPLSGTQSVVGAWQDPGTGDIYIFDGSRCSINLDYANAAPYHTHWETVYTSSNSPFRTLVYSVNDAPEEGYALLDGNLRFVIKGNTRWEFWYALTKANPILGRWMHAGDRNGYRFEFDSTTWCDYYTCWDSHDGRGMPYRTIDAVVRVYDSDWKTYRDNNVLLYRVPVDAIAPEVTLRGYAFINGILYDIRSNSPGEQGLETGPGFECVRV